MQEMFVSPMLAGPMPKHGIDYKDYVAEEKYDGHRLIVHIQAGRIFAWSRYGLRRALPSHLEELRDILPSGTYDGELLAPGKRSYGVTELANGPDLRFVIFDVLRVGETETFNVPWHDRRILVERCVTYLHDDKRAIVAPIVELFSEPQMNLLLEDMWKNDKEGLILKHKRGLYQPEKRPKGTFIKLKALRSCVMEIIGFEAGKRGPHSKVHLRGADGSKASVKTLNDMMLARIGVAPMTFIGKQLRIEYQERTPDGSYRHPRWDRLEDE